MSIAGPQVGGTAQYDHSREDTIRHLEQVSYYMVHEMRPPLRTIQVACHDLQVQHGDASKRDGLLRRVLNSTLLLAGLIDDLTGFARIGQTSLKLIPLDLSEIARELFASLNHKDTVLYASTGVILTADKPLMIMAIKELLKNAQHFRKPQSSIVIELSSEEIEGETVFTFRDNGLGFDPRYAAHIFRVFERLDVSRVDTGRGMGLAKVQRIIELHRGRIWAESQPGQGAAFHFSLWIQPGS